MDFVDGRAERGVELVLGHLRAQIFEQSAAEAGDDAVVLGQFRASLGPRIAARQRHHAQHARVSHQRIEQARFHRQAELEHHFICARPKTFKRVERLEQFFEQDLVDVRAGRAFDVHFGFEHRHQPGGEDLLPHFELLRDDRGDAFAVGRLDDRTLLGTEHAQRLRLCQQRIQIGHRLHQLDAIHLVFQAFVDLDERYHALGDQRLRHRYAIYGSIHRALEQDRAQDLVAVERLAANDPAAHVVDQAEHRIVARIFGFFNAIALERLGRRATRLVERCDKAVSASNLCGHVGGGHRGSWHGRAGPRDMHRYAKAGCAALSEATAEPQPPELLDSSAFNPAMAD